MDENEDFQCLYNMDAFSVGNVSNADFMDPFDSSLTPSPDLVDSVC